MKQIRILQINAGSKNFGGVSAMLLNIYRNIDKNLVQFDFLTPNYSTYSQYQSEIEQMGGHIFDFHINSSNFLGKLKLYCKLKRFFKENSYDIIHINSGVLSFNMIVAMACKKYSNAKVIVHSHNAGGRTFFKNLIVAPMKKIMEHNADTLLSCSNAASNYMFTRKGKKKVQIVKNGIDTARFVYNQDIRQKIRTDMNLDNKFVIGNIGRFMPQKNHTFMIDVFKEVKKQCNNAVLMLIGQGELENQIREKVKELDLEDSVLFLGQRKDVSDLYQAMDVFFLPSLYEGLGIVNIEAQTSGLICVTSDTIPEEANVTNTMIRISLNQPISVWVDALLKAVNNERIDNEEQVKKFGYDIKIVASNLADLYKKIL